MFVWALTFQKDTGKNIGYYMCYYENNGIKIYYGYQILHDCRIWWQIFYIQGLFKRISIRNLEIGIIALLYSNIVIMNGSRYDDLLYLNHNATLW